MLHDKRSRCIPVLTSIFPVKNGASFALSFGERADDLPTANFFVKEYQVC